MTEEKSEKAMDALLEKITDMIFYTMNVAKEIIRKTNELKELKVTPQECLFFISSHIKDFEEVKEGYENEKI